jgi:glucosamine--fructose-6-phosphate aminotransferase (isomerizing)
MSELAQWSFAEIMSQHESWRDAIANAGSRSNEVRNLLQRYADAPLLFVACGSPYFLGRSAVALTRQWLGRPSRAVPASELLLYPETVLGQADRPLMVAFSRSGETSETIGAARLARARRGALLAIGCDASTTLFRMADGVIEIPAGRERSVAQTRSFAGMFAAWQMCAAALSEHPGAAAFRADLARLPELGEQFVARARAEIGPVAADTVIERIFFLGSGVRYGLACEASLKMKEMSLTNAEAFHVPEFRHGPISMADERALVVGLIGATAPEEELAVLREAHQFGARTLALVEAAPEDTTGLDAIFAFQSGLAEAARDVLYLPPVQLLACERAVAKGLDPDTSRNITTFVHRPTLAARGS